MPFIYSFQILNLQSALRDKKTPFQLVRMPVVAVEREKRSITRRLQQAAREFLPPNSTRARIPSNVSTENEDEEGPGSPSGDELDAPDSPNSVSRGHFTTRYSRRPFFTRF